MIYFIFTPYPRSGAVAVRRYCHIQGQKNPSKTVSTGAAMRRNPASKGKGKAPARW